jgi:23S rRNA pseudouridine1911/1915/1917 synthase
MHATSHQQIFSVEEQDATKRLDHFLVARLGAEVSRARVQQLIEEQKVHVNARPAKASLRVRLGDQVAVLGDVQPKPLKAFPEEIPLDVVYEDSDLAVVNKPAGMMVHAGAARQLESRSQGTLVNALLHRFAGLSHVGGALRPGIVHRLDKDTSGLVVVAKNDVAHRKLAEQFSRRQVRKKYVALVHGAIKSDSGTISSAISRDRIRRTRMTVRRQGGRAAISHYRVLERIDSGYGKFSLLEVTIETGRTHQIRVHLSSLGHPVVGDTLYGAPRELAAKAKLPRKKDPGVPAAALGRNFLHAIAIEFLHPRTGAPLVFQRPLPPELKEFLARIRAGLSQA